MKVLNWIKFITVFLVALTFVIVITIFYSASRPLVAATSTATDAALASKEIVSVASVQPYNGTVPLLTVFGNNPDGEAIALFVNEEMDGNYESVKLSDGITAKDAVQTVEKELKVTDVLHVALGIEEDGPVWEVVFTNEQDKLNYVYVRFENGQWSKRILNL